MSLLKNAVSTGVGMLSLDPVKRISSIELLLSYLLHRLPHEVREDHFQVAPGLTYQHMPNAKLYPNREAMLHVLPKGGTVAEVGTWRGDFSERIASICAPDEFHLVDIDFGPLNEAKVRAGLKGTLHKHQGDSSTTLAAFPAGFFDWLYIDGDHTYAAVRKDLAAAHRALKPGGYMVCNDYTNWDVSSAQPYGVAKAVNELCLAENYEVLGLALHGAGYPDILLRKPR